MAKGYDRGKYGYIFNIQQYSLHDGEGIRTMVFLKGCPMRCRWCANPESQQLLPELAYNCHKCIGIIECMQCIEVCCAGAIKKDEDNKIIIDRQLCNNCLNCVQVCPSRALNVFGNLLSIDEVFQAVAAEEVFHARSGGGLTLGGGEPFFQAEFSLALLKEAKKRRIHTAVETAGYTAWENLAPACEYLDQIIYDLKILDEQKHRDCTGVSNRLILDNFEKICAAFPAMPVTVRTAIIPGFNDREEDLFALVDFIAGRPNVTFEPLAYHRFGQPKYAYLGRPYPLADIKTDEQKINSLKEKALRRYCQI